VNADMALPAVLSTALALARANLSGPSASYAVPEPKLAAEMGPVTLTRMMLLRLHALASTDSMGAIAATSALNHRPVTSVTRVVNAKQTGFVTVTRVLPVQFALINIASTIVMATVHALPAAANAI